MVNSGLAQYHWPDTRASSVTSTRLTYSKRFALAAGPCSASSTPMTSPLAVLVRQVRSAKLRQESHR